MSLRNPLPLGIAAGALDTGGAIWIIVRNTPLALLIAACLHVVAALLTCRAARRRRNDMSRVEADVVWWMALLVPVFGPAYGWRIPRAPATEEEENAHSVFEQYAEHVTPADAGYERTLFTGDYERDLARELDAESYHEVLRQGSTDQKRNALRRLQELGEPKHFELIRGCLLDPSHEVRLYAYSELERGARVYEEEIAKCAKQLEKKPGSSDVLLAMARAYFDYAASGIHDSQMAAFYFRSAERHGGQARAADPTQPEPVWVQANAFGRLSEYDAALECLAQLSPQEQGLPQSCLVRAELAYRRRDFAAIREEAARLKSTDTAVPAWLGALEAKK